MKKQFFFLLSAMCLLLTACENYTTNTPPPNQPGRNEPGRRDQMPGQPGQPVQPGGPGHADRANPQGGR